MRNDPAEMIRNRQHRCQAMGVSTAECRTLIEHPTALATVVSSRLGHDSVRHRKMARHLAESMQSFQRSESTVLIIRGTAIENWAIDAAKVFHVPTLVVDSSPHRDRWMAAIPDRVDAVYLRKKGKLLGLIKERLASGASGATRVAIDGPPSHDLLQHGAVGSYLSTDDSATTTTSSPSTPLGSIDWNEYLVHCTRSAQGCWPGQTPKQYRHDFILGDSIVASRTVSATLRRIVQQRRLIAGAVTSNQKFPVVCFTEVPLPEILRRRTYRSHLHRWDYEPYGIAIRKSAAIRIGIQPVVYSDAEQASSLSPEDRYRFQAKGEQNDWTKEQEWRASGDVDLDRLPTDDVAIFLAKDPLTQSISSLNQKQWRLAIID